jgi:PPK2 family polyphosphate:nucleotide phosphotransferase
MDHRPFLVKPKTKVSLADYDPAFTDGYEGKAQGKDKLKKDAKRLGRYQELLYAQNRQSVLIILQGMDTSGKDGTIKHVMSGANPQGTQVHSFKAPAGEELEHDFLWRAMRRLPERGNITIFNRSYYEEVLVVRVHPDLIGQQALPAGETPPALWDHRFEDINNFEKYLVRNGIIVLKFFLNLSKDEQRRRLLARIDDPEKHWKFSAGDVTQRGHWDEYIAAYEDAIANTSTRHAPWYIVPADHKWFTRMVVADVIVKKLRSLELAVPALGPADLEGLAVARNQLEAAETA